MSVDKSAVILAAGEGKRMKSSLPKVMHLCAGLPLVAHVVQVALDSGCSPVVVVVSPSSLNPVRAFLTQRFAGVPLLFAVQHVARGTGDAVRVGTDALPSASRGSVCVLSGDVPLLQSRTLNALIEAKQNASMALLSSVMDNPYGYGRVLRDAQGRVSRIVEQRDASVEEQSVREVNAGVYCVDVDVLRGCLGRLTTHNAQGEYYFTDVVAMVSASGQVVSLPLADPSEVMGVNTAVELARVQALMHAHIVRAHVQKGVVCVDPDHVWIDADVRIGDGVRLGVGVQLYGATHVNDGAVLEGPLYVRDSVLGEGAYVRSFSHVESAQVGAGCEVGPYARLRPGTVLYAHARVGNFVELKNTQLGAGSKVNHLSYVGDCDVAERVNVGAGTVTCNYDGVSKHRTVIGQGVFVGSNTTLVAPVDIKEGAYVAAGSVITKEVPADALAFGRSKQVNREGYAQVLRARQKQTTHKK